MSQHMLARSGATWSALEANGAGDGGEVPATLLLQAGKKHITASDPNAAARRLMAHALLHPGR